MAFRKTVNYRKTKSKVDVQSYSNSILFALRLTPLPDERERSNICHWIFSFVIRLSIIIISILSE